MRISARTVPGRCPGRLSGIGPVGSASSPSLLAHFSSLRIQPGHRWYGPVVPRSPILPLAAAVTAVALSASPAQAAPFLAGKRDGAAVVAFPLLAVKGQASASAGAHVSHSSHESHVSGTGGHYSHVSHVSHVSSVPAPSPTSAAPVVSQPPASASPAPAVSVSSGGSPTVAPPQGSLTGSPAGSPAVVGSGSPATSNGSGCAFVIVAPFGALAGRIRRLARREKER